MRRSLLAPALAFLLGSGIYGQGKVPEFPLITNSTNGYQDLVTGRVYRIKLRFESSVKCPAKSDCEFTYSVSNEGETPIRIEWKALEDTEFRIVMDALARDFIKPNSKKEIKAHTPSRSIKVNDYPTKIYVKDSLGFDTFIGTNGPLAYVPQ